MQVVERAKEKDADYFQEITSIFLLREEMKQLQDRLRRVEQRLEITEWIDMRATYTALSPYYTNAIEYRNKLREKLAKLDGKGTENPDVQRPDFLGRSASDVIKIAACLVLIVALGRYLVVRPDNAQAKQEEVSTNE